MKKPFLKAGDEIRIVAPACNFSIMSQPSRQLAQKRLEQLKLKVTYAKNINKAPDTFTSYSVKDRLNDLHEAYKDKKVKAILAVIGGFNSEELLDHLDYDLIKKNPKPIIGYSDMTVLHLAIYARTGVSQVTGPSFVSFGQRNGFDYSLNGFKQILFSTKSFDVKPSKVWTNSKWWMDHENIAWIKNKKFLNLQNGVAEGKIIAGNMCTFQLLFGTKYMPDLTNSILFLEETETGEEGEDGTLKFFMRDFGSLLRQKGADKIKGIVIGRFPYNAFVTEPQLKEMIARRKDQLKNIPIMYGVDFGHTYPLMSIPIGGHAKLSVKGKNIKLRIMP